MAFVAPINRVVSFLLYLSIFLLPFGQISRLEPIAGVRVYLVDIVVFLIALIWLVTLVVRKSFITPPLTPNIILFTGVGAISILISFLSFSPQQVGIGSLYLLRFICYASIYFVAYEFSPKKHLLKALLISGVISVVFGLFQYFLYPNLRNLIYLGWDPHEYRVFGTLFDSGFAGIIYVLTLILIAYLWHEFRNKTWLCITGVITYVAFALTYARSSYVAFLMAFLILSILKRTYKYALYSVLILGLTLFWLPRPSKTSEGVKLERTASISARGDNYLQTFEIIKDNPILGVGFNTLRYENNRRGNIAAENPAMSNAAAGSDSSLLFVAATTGILGLIAYVLLWIQMIRIELAKEKVNRSPLLVLPIIGALLVNSLFLNSLFYIWVMLWLWILLGVSHGSGNGIFVTSSVTSNYLKSIFSFRKIKG